MAFKRRSINRKQSRRQFSRGADRIHKKNFLTNSGVSRGGIRF